MFLFLHILTKFKAQLPKDSNGSNSYFFKTENFKYSEYEWLRRKK